ETRARENPACGAWACTRRETPKLRPSQFPTLAPAERSVARRQGQFGGRALNRLAGVFEHLAHQHNLLAGLLPLLLLDTFAHAGQSLHAVAGVEARRVNLIFVPGPIRQSLIRS